MGPGGKDGNRTEEVNAGEEVVEITAEGLNPSGYGYTRGSDVSTIHLQGK